MERELFFTGYCRVLDGSRTVEAILEDGVLSEVDCCYGSCIYQGSCPIAQSMDEAAGAGAAVPPDNGEPLSGQ